MRNLLVAAALAALTAAPAHALVVTGFDSGTPTSQLTVVTATGSLLELDFTLGRSDNAVTLTREAGDADEIDFNAFFDFLNPIDKLNFTWTLVDVRQGSARAAFSSVDVSSEDENYLFDFQPDFEFVSFELGNVLGGGTNFVIDISDIAVGDSFQLFFTAIPTPAAVALFGLGVAGVAVARRRRAA